MMSHPSQPELQYPTRAQRQMYEQTTDLGRRRRLQRLVLLPLHMGYDSSSLGKYGCRARIQPSCATGLREAHLRPQHARGCMNSCHQFLDPRRCPPIIRFTQLVSIPLHATRQYSSGKSMVSFGDDPQPLPGVCLVAAQQSKPMGHAVFILRDIAWLQFAPVAGCIGESKAATYLSLGPSCNRWPASVGTWLETGVKWPHPRRPDPEAPEGGGNETLPLLSARSRLNVLPLLILSPLLLLQES